MSALAAATAIAADFMRDAREASFACRGCGSPDPARIDGATCSDCRDFDRCACGRWTFAERATPVTFPA